MALTALVATLCAVSLVAIRWLALLGVVRDFAVTDTTGSASSFSTSAVHRQLGLATGPSVALTHLDHLMWVLGLGAGVLWMLRLGLRSADRRIGVMRGLGLVIGFAVFVVTGVMHCIVEAVTTEKPDRTHRLITCWCATAVLSAVLLMFSLNSGPQSFGPPVIGTAAALTPLGWSIAGLGLQLAVVIGGWLLAVSLTRRWIDLVESPTSLNRPLASRV